MTASALPSLAAPPDTLRVEGSLSAIQVELPRRVDAERAYWRTMGLGLLTFTVGSLIGGVSPFLIGLLMGGMSGSVLALLVDEGLRLFPGRTYRQHRRSRSGRHQGGGCAALSGAVLLVLPLLFLLVTRAGVQGPGALAVAILLLAGMLWLPVASATRREHLRLDGAWLEVQAHPLPLRRFLGRGRGRGRRWSLDTLEISAQGPHQILLNGEAVLALEGLTPVERTWLVAMVQQASQAHRARLLRAGHDLSAPAEVPEALQALQQGRQPEDMR